MNISKFQRITRHKVSVHSYVRQDTEQIVEEKTMYIVEAMQSS